MKKLNHSSLNNISHVLPILSTSEKKRTSRGRPQPFKTMLYRLYFTEGNKKQQHPNFEEYRVGGYLGHYGLFLFLRNSTKKSIIRWSFKFYRNSKIFMFSLYTIYTSVEPR